jgi:hypothetical protein
MLTHSRKTGGMGLDDGARARAPGDRSGRPRGWIPLISHPFVIGLVGAVALLLAISFSHLLYEVRGWRAQHFVSLFGLLSFVAYVLVASAFAIFRRPQQPAGSPKEGWAEGIDPAPAPSSPLYDPQIDG